MIILGIDPGSRHTGFGVIHFENNQSRYLASGCIHLSTLDQSERLQTIFNKMREIVETFNPIEAAIEQIFMHENPNSALKLGQARGAAIVACKTPVAEYSARQVKQSVVGYGAASKEQVQQMVKRLLNLSQKLQADEADALAVALCHAHSRFALTTFVVRKRKSSWRSYVGTGNN